MHYFHRRHITPLSILLIERDSWSSEIDVFLQNQITKWKQYGWKPEIPKVILLVTSESDKVKAGSFVDTVITKPLRARIVAACLQEFLGVEKKQKREMSNGSCFLNGLLIGRRILVVDDNKVNLRVAAGALKRLVERVESGKDVLSLLQHAHSFDACFMDVHMPEMDGYTC